MVKKTLFIFLIYFLNANYSMAKDNFKHGISVFNNLKYSKNFEHFNYVSSKAKKGGTIKLGVEGSFNSLNPFILKGISAQGIDYIYDSLMVKSGDEISSYYPLLAKSVKISDDNYSISFILNDKARFSDNEKVTADDVIFTFDILRNEGHPAYKIALKDIKKIIKISDYQVKFIFKNNKNKDLPFLIASMKILPQHFYQNKKFNDSSIDFVIGSGPYKIKEIKPSKTIIFQRRDEYWAKNLPVNKYRYNFDEIRYDYYLDSSVMIEAFKASEFDIRQENIARNWANSYNIDKVKNGKIIKTEIKNNLPAPMQAFIFNLRKRKFQDKNLRQALTFAFNFEWLKKHIFYGSYKRTESFFANSIFGKTIDLPVSEADGFGRKNLIIAKNILEKSGYKIKDQKLISPITNKPLEIEFLIASKSFEMIISPFIDNLKKLGIDAKIRYEEENQFQSRLRNFDYDIITAVYPQNQIPGSELIRYFHSSQANIKGSQNYLGLKNDKIDYLVEKISKTKRKDKLIKLCQKFDEIMLKNYYVIPQWHNDSYRILYYNKIKRPKKSPQYSLGFDSWWIEEYN